MDFGYSIDGNRICENCHADMPLVSYICGKCKFVPRPLPLKSDANAALSGNAPNEPETVAGPQTEPTPGGFTFRLSSLMLTTTLVAVCLGVGTWSPSLAVVLVLLAVPAYVRTALVGLRLRREGRPLTIERKILTYLASLSIATGTVVAPVASFCTICGIASIGTIIVGGAFGWHELDLLGPALLIGLYFGAIAAVAAFLASLRWFWPFRKVW